MKKVLKRSWRWNEDGSPPPPPPPPKPTEEPKMSIDTSLSKAVPLRTTLKNSREQKRDALRLAIKQTLEDKKTEDTVKMPKVRRLINELNALEPKYNEKDYDANQDYEECEGDIPAPSKLGYFDPGNRFKASIPDTENCLTSEQLTSRYKHILQNAFYGMVERIGLDVINRGTLTRSEYDRYDMRELMNRTVTKKALPKCKEYLEREEVFLFTDSSGSCQGVSAIINSVAEIVSARGDCVLLVNPDCDVCSLYPYTSKEEDRTRRVVSQDSKFLHKKYNKGKKHLFHNNGDGHGGHLLPLDTMEGKTVIMLSDSDGYSGLHYVMQEKPKRVIFLDLMNYLVNRGFTSDNLTLHDINTRGIRAVERSNYTRGRDIVGYFQGINETMERVIRIVKGRVMQLPLEDEVFNSHAIISTDPIRLDWFYVHDAKDLLKIFRQIK